MNNGKIENKWSSEIYSQKSDKELAKDITDNLHFVENKMLVN